MTTNDPTGAAAHLKAIRNIVNDREYVYPDIGLYEISDHAEALAKHPRAAALLGEDG